MKVALDTVMLDADDKPIEKDNSKEPVTLTFLVRNALLNSFMDEQNLEASEKVKRFDLWMDIRGGRADLTPEEIVLIKKLIGKLYGPLIVGQAFRLLG